jgi:hypothetical protein
MAAMVNAPPPLARISTISGVNIVLLLSYLTSPFRGWHFHYPLTSHVLGKSRCVEVHQVAFVGALGGDEPREAHRKCEAAKVENPAAG